MEYVSSHSRLLQPYVGLSSATSVQRVRSLLRCAKNRDLWKVVFEEDIEVVEGMQAGRLGLYFDGGRFSPVMDSPTHNFHHWVAERISKQSVAD